MEALQLKKSQHKVYISPARPISFYAYSIGTESRHTASLIFVLHSVESNMPSASNETREGVFLSLLQKLGGIVDLSRMDAPVTVS